MAYRIFLIEDLGTTTNHIELDTEDIDFAAMFSVADIADISKRKDHMTKRITFKATKKNNSAFGNLFLMNKLTDHTLDNKLFFNYNPLKIVDCLIYEDSTIILRGSMRVLPIKVDKNNNVLYNTVVTGAIIDFKEIIADKKLEDLDFSDLQHRWNWTKIKQTWTQSTERYDSVTKTYSDTPFQKGNGYVYPFIDYGESFKIKELNNPWMDPYVNVRNFRPAIYVKEYFDRIFAQDELKNFTYEINDPSGKLQAEFNSLIIPNNVEKQIERTTDTRLQVYRSISIATDNSQNSSFNDDKKYEIPIRLNAGNIAGPMFHTLLEWYGNYRGQDNVVMRVKKNFTTDGVLKVELKNLKNQSIYTPNMTIHLEICERDSVSNEKFADASTWKPFASQSVTIPFNVVQPTKQIQFEMGEHNFKEGTQIMVRLVLESPMLLGSGPLQYEIGYGIDKTSLILPKDQTSGVVTQDLIYGDVIKPKPPINIKQIDFIKSIITIFNLYVYVEPTRPKHLIFQTHDQFYTLCELDRLKTQSLDWTRKIDFNAGFDIKYNMELPKKYSFAWKDDTDHVNKDYKDSFNDTYGNLNFTDALGVVEQKKIELIFASSPAVEYPATDRIHPTIVQKDGTMVKPTKSIIRIQYYNGMKTCMKWHVGYDNYELNLNATPEDPEPWKWVSEIVESNITAYPMCSEYYFVEGVNNLIPTKVMQFGLPKRLYYGNTELYMNTPNVYGLHYINQITQLSNPNTLFVDCEVVLNEIDIANLDLKRPVFVDFGSYNHAYFKVLDVEYSHKGNTASVKLQKIAI